MSRTLRSARLVSLTVFTFVLASPGALADSGGEWEELASMAVARQECGAARIGNNVYVVGGLLSNGVASDSVEVYDIDADEWSPAAPLPDRRDHMGVAAVAGKLYVIGGYRNDFHARANVYEYDPAANEWTEKAPLPQPRGACWAVAHGGLIYVFGGADVNDIAQRSTFIYDPAQNEWSQGADMPTAREHLTAAAAGEFIYVIGGRRGGAFNLNERYDPANDRWDTMAPMPTARSAMGVAAFGRRIIVAGGEIPRLFEVNEVYDITTNTWSCNADMPIPRHGLAAVTLDDRIFMPAGGIIQGLRPTNRADSFIPPPATNGDANAFEIITGAHLDGGLSALFESDDVAVQARSSFGASLADLHKMEILIHALTDHPAPSTIDVLVEARIDEPSGLSRLLLRNWNTGAFDQVASDSIGMSDGIFSATGIAAGDYIGPNGEIDLMVRHNVFRPFLAFTFESFIDQVEIDVE